VPQLNTKAGSSTPKQHQALALAGKRLGFDLADIRQIVTGKHNGSIRALSAAEASQWIEQLTGQTLPNPPGKKPRPYQGKRAEPGTIRMIADDHVDQIIRLGLRYFGDAPPFHAWLTKCFKVPFVALHQPEDTRFVVRRLGTAKRGRDVIQVLKTMIARRASDNQEPANV
jgi:hypothetical protein